MLSTNVKSTSDLMSIALQAEREAIRRYTELGTAMRDAGNESAAVLFERMVAEEQEHERLLLEWMAQENIQENSDIPEVKWSDPNISTTYNDEARDPYQSSPYRALAFAVHNEEIAFRFYTHVAAESEDETVRNYAEVLAREELGHAALLRAERRRAYHAEREADMVEPRLDPAVVHNEADLLAIAIHIDNFLVAEMDCFIDRGAEIEALVNATRIQISSNEEALRDAGEQDDQLPGDDIASKLSEIDSYNRYLENTINTPDTRLQRLCACCDRSFTFYDAVVETAEDEKVMLAAQALTSSALDRIGILKQVLGKQCGCTD